MNKQYYQKEISQMVCKMMDDGDICDGDILSLLESAKFSMVVSKVVQIVEAAENNS